jgi:steroid delta-isomerase-like uncharacterized protein
MATDTTPTIRERREAIVREHVEAENRHDGEATIATFDHPRYEIIATGEIFDGASEVQSFYDENYGAFPDFSVTIEHTHHAEESVVAEGTITGTHLGTYRGLPPTSRSPLGHSRTDCRSTPRPGAGTRGGPTDSNEARPCRL